MEREDPKDVMDDQQLTQQMVLSCGFEPEAVHRLKELKVEEAKARESRAAGWHNSDDIQSLAGLDGNYLWSENPFNVNIICFTFFEGKSEQEGTYRLYSNAADPSDLDTPPLERGTFTCIPNNPAIGWAMITLKPDRNHNPRGFTVAGMMTDATGEIDILLLNKLGQHGPIMPSFSAIRCQGQGL